MNKNNFDVAIFGNGLTSKVMCLVALHYGVSFINIKGKEKEEKMLMILDLLHYPLHQKVCLKSLVLIYYPNLLKK